MDRRGFLKAIGIAAAPTIIIPKAAKLYFGSNRKRVIKCAPVGIIDGEIYLHETGTGKIIKKSEVDYNKFEIVIDKDLEKFTQALDDLHCYKRKNDMEEIREALEAPIEITSEDFGTWESEPMPKEGVQVYRTMSGKEWNNIYKHTEGIFGINPKEIGFKNG
jgi:hypothetical protein